MNAIVTGGEGVICGETSLDIGTGEVHRTCIVRGRDVAGVEAVTVKLKADPAATLAGVAVNEKWVTELLVMLT
jgi:hypothetical protein